MNSETPTSSEDFLALPLPGETLYGRCARTAHWSRRSPAEVSEWLLGHRRGPKQFDMLSGLDRLKEVHEHRGMHLQIEADCESLKRCGTCENHVDSATH